MKISVADGAQNALNLIDSKEFDVVLCDIALPDGNGYDVIAQAKRRRPVKAVALTGFGTSEDVERGKGSRVRFPPYETGGLSRVARCFGPDRRLENTNESTGRALRDGTNCRASASLAGVFDVNWKADLAGGASALQD